jgi:hypothetical protein
MTDPLHVVRQGWRFEKPVPVYAGRALSILTFDEVVRLDISPISTQSVA